MGLQTMPVPVEDEGLRRYTGADREAAYFFWRTVAGRNLAHVARVTGVPYRTLDNWKREGGWVDRANADDAETRSVAATAIQMAIIYQALPSIMTAVELRDDPECDKRTRLEAAKWLAGLQGIVPAQKSEVEIRARDAARRVREFDQMDDKQLAEYVRRHLPVGDAAEEDDDAE